MKVEAGQNYDSLLTLHGVTVVLENSNNTVQEVIPPQLASTVAISNYSTSESVVVVFFNTAPTSGNKSIRLFPLEDIVVGFETKTIQKITIRACNIPTVTSEDSELSIKEGPLQGTHYVGVRFVSERLDSGCCS